MSPQLLTSLLLAVSLLMGATGCSEQGDRSDPALNTKAARLSKQSKEALTRKDYKAAVTNALAIANVTDLSEPQRVAYKNLLQNLKLALADAAVSGDPQAADAIKLFKSSAVGR